MRDLLEGRSDDSGLRQLARREIRTRMRALRNLLSPETVAARSTATCAHVNALTCVREARAILSYSPIRNEIDPASVVDGALRNGVTVGLPRVEEDGSLSVLRYAGETLEPDQFGVLAPASAAEPLDLSTLDVVLVPALAVDPRGHRLGYGRGFYDRLLCQLPGVAAVALVHPFQVVVELADMPGDVPVSWIATETGVVSARRE